MIRAFTLSVFCAVTLSAGGVALAQVKLPKADLDQCARCHGEEGIARDTEVPNLAGQNEAYLVNQLRAFRSGARRHPDMRFMSRTMTDAEIEAYAAYYTALKP